MYHYLKCVSVLKMVVTKTERLTFCDLAWIRYDPQAEREGVKFYLILLQMGLMDAVLRIYFLLLHGRLFKMLGFFDFFFFFLNMIKKNNFECS